MDKKEANLVFHHSEKLKSNIFLLSAALDRLATLKAERLEGGKEVIKGMFDALRTELNIARRYIGAGATHGIERELFNVEAEMEVQDHARAREYLARTLSQVTTISNKYIGLLIEENLI